MFASDSPVLSISRTVKEATELDLPDEVLDNYLFGNSEAFFFSRFEHKRSAP
jgi:predicted TIM-barrel fold metal-dependent hydrolase